jgi:hypothetical protein
MRAKRIRKVERGLEVCVLTAILNDCEMGLCKKVIFAPRLEGDGDQPCKAG